MLWSYFVTDERHAKEVKSGKTSGWIVGIGAPILAAAVSWRVWTNLSDQTPLAFRLLAGIFILALCIGAGWLTRQMIKTRNELPPDSDRRFMLVTSERLLATDLNGRILDEMPKAEIEFVVDQHKSGDFLVTRVGDNEGTRSFFMPMMDDYKAAARAVRDLRLGD